METTVVWGLLWAGKTTYMQCFEQSDEKKTDVLLNDFGRAGIDGELLCQRYRLHGTAQRLSLLHPGI